MWVVLLFGAMSLVGAWVCLRFAFKWLGYVVFGMLLGDIPPGSKAWDDYWKS